MITNPFHYGKPVTDPDHFFGRRREIEQIVTRLQNVSCESSSIVGERRIGKTSLLQHFLSPAALERHGFTPEYVFGYLSFEGFSHITPIQFWRWVLEELEPKIEDEQLKGQVRVVRQADTVDLFAIRRLFDHLTRKGLRVVLLFDEFEYVIRNKNFDADFYGGLRHLATNYNLALVTSSSRELIYYCHSAEIAGSPFFNIFANITLKPFTQEEACLLIKEYLEGTPVSFSREDVAWLLHIAGCHPYFLQIAGFFLFDAYTREEYAGPEKVDRRRKYVEERFEENAIPNFVYYWGHSENGKKITLAALALQSKRYPDRTITADDLKRLYTQVESALSPLIKRSLVVEHDVGYHLFSPVFQEWIIGELTDVSAESEMTLEQWLQDYQKKLVERVYERTREVISGVNPKYWEIVGRWLSDSKNREQVAELFAWLFRTK
jgi:hypothetical protein